MIYAGCNSSSSVIENSSVSFKGRKMDVRLWWLYLGYFSCQFNCCWSKDWSWRPVPVQEIQVMTSRGNCFFGRMWYVAKTLVGVLSMANAKDEVRRTLIQGDELKERNWKIKDAEIKNPEWNEVKNGGYVTEGIIDWFWSSDSPALYTYILYTIYSTVVKCNEADMLNMCF